MEDLLDPIRTEKKIGKAEVRNPINVPKLGTIAGSAVLEGVIKRSAILKLVRQGLDAGQPQHPRRALEAVRFPEQVFQQRLVGRRFFQP